MLILLSYRETLLCLDNLNRVGDAGSKSVAGLAERALGQCTTAFSHLYLLAGCRKRKNRAPNLEVHAAIRVFVFGAPLGKDSISLGDICAISAPRQIGKLTPAETENVPLDCAGFTPTKA